MLMHEPNDTSNWAVAANATSIHSNDAPVKSASVSAATTTARQCSIRRGHHRALQLQADVYP